MRTTSTEKVSEDNSLCPDPWHVYWCNVTKTPDTCLVKHRTVVHNTQDTLEPFCDLQVECSDQRVPSVARKRMQAREKKLKAEPCLRKVYELRAGNEVGAHAKCNS